VRGWFLKKIAKSEDKVELVEQPPTDKKKKAA